VTVGYDRLRVYPIIESERGPSSSASASFFSLFFSVVLSSFFFPADATSTFSAWALRQPCEQADRNDLLLASSNSPDSPISGQKLA
jgi:hypothetical protein